MGWGGCVVLCCDVMDEIKVMFIQSNGSAG